MNSTTKYILSTIAGLITGILLMSILSNRASETYREIMQINYNIYQEQTAIQALKDSNYPLAVHHFKNLVESSFPESVFENSKGMWTGYFPFASEVLIKIKAHSDPKGIGGKRVRGINHGMLAYALEKNNMNDEAETEWQQAMQLLEMKRISQVKDLINHLNKPET